MPKQAVLDGTVDGGFFPVGFRLVRLDYEDSEIIIDEASGKIYVPIDNEERVELKFKEVDEVIKCLYAFLRKFESKAISNNVLFTGTILLLSYNDNYGLYIDVSELKDVLAQAAKDAFEFDISTLEI